MDSGTIEGIKPKQVVYKPTIWTFQLIIMYLFDFTIYYSIYPEIIQTISLIFSNG